MTGSGGQWDLPYPFDVVSLDPADDGEWRALGLALSRADEGDAATDRPLIRCLEIARENGARTLVIETRYVDLDYRSEFSAFYSKAFDTFEDCCQRLHFFSESISPRQVLRLTKTQRSSYLGYLVLRPQVRAAVGRTMLRPPGTAMKDAVRTAVRETVTLFGQPLEVRAVPFMQQDARLGSCAHVAIWMCHYSAYRGDQRVARLPVADFSLTTDGSLGIGRIMPTPGLTINQMSDVLTRSGLAPIYYDASTLSDNDRPEGAHWLRQRDDPAAQLSRVCCRYLNSGLPVIAVVRHVRGSARAKPDFDRGSLHAVVVCGYFRSDDSVTLIAHDDRRGPYLTYENVRDDYDPDWQEHCRWEHILAPVPQKLWLTGEAAERHGSEHLLTTARVVMTEIPASKSMVTKFNRDQLSFRTYAITGTRFKNRTAEAVTDPVVLAAYREARLPHYVWVVEAIDKVARERGEPECVLAEVVYDATSDERWPQVLATRVPGAIEVRRPDVERPRLNCDLTSPRRSSGQYSP
jgi:hypothetical protein